MSMLIADKVTFSSGYGTIGDLSLRAFADRLPFQEGHDKFTTQVQHP